jgi:hypothetical protein
VKRRDGLSYLLVLAPAALVAWRVFAGPTSEPFYNNDETRHLMSGVFVADFLRAWPIADWKAFATDYYLRYPALGIPLYPPLFYILEGTLMILFGASVLVGKALVILFLATACAYLYRIVRPVHGPWAAGAAALVFGMTPQIVELSGQVMLDVPMVALALASLYHFERYLDSGRRADVTLAGSFASAAALTRYSAVYLPIALVLLALLRRRGRVMLRPEVLLVAAAATAVILPYYFFAAETVGWLHLVQVSGTGSAKGPLGVGLQAVDYVANLPGQVGWMALGTAFVSWGARAAKRAWSGSEPFVALGAATLLAFSPMAIHGQRLVISWVPALAFFAIDGAILVGAWTRRPSLGWTAAILVAIGTAAVGLRGEPPFLRGYADAARYVLRGSEAAKYCVFDGGLNGDFVYQVRVHDPRRRLGVLRGDRLLYSILIQPEMGNREWARSDSQMIADLRRYDPAYVIVEEPPVRGFDTPAAVRLRRILDSRTDLYERVATFPIETNQAALGLESLAVYRSRMRTGGPPPPLQIDVPALRGALGVDSTGP